LQKVKNDSTTSINKTSLPEYLMHGLDPPYFLDMKQTAVYFESKPKTVVAKKGSRLYLLKIVEVTTNIAQQWWLLLQQMVPSCPFSFPGRFLAKQSARLVFFLHTKSKSSSCHMHPLFDGSRC
jgi:hypothetical protein